MVCKEEATSQTKDSGKCIPYLSIDFFHRETKVCDSVCVCVCSQIRTVRK